MWNGYRAEEYGVVNLSETSPLLNKLKSYVNLCMVMAYDICESGSESKVVC